ncbi:hypothetical protein ACFY00_03590 [Kitasatospora sp. NPDC001540]|uniref:hypothetical protein n=1 Tax=Kitasatospora sp. NPDC001540 TaxID=3364014 RepID=UPI0036AA1A45
MPTDLLGPLGPGSPERVAPPTADRLSDEPGDGERELLAMTTAGAKDAVIARSPGATRRTMTRRTARPMGEPNARARFQSGLQGVDHGCEKAG